MFHTLFLTAEETLSIQAQYLRSRQLLLMMYLLLLAVAIVILGSSIFELVPLLQTPKIEPVIVLAVSFAAFSALLYWARSEKAVKRSVLLSGVLPLLHCGVIYVNGFVPMTALPVGVLASLLILRGRGAYFLSIGYVVLAVIAYQLGGHEMPTGYTERQVAVALLLIVPLNQMISAKSFNQAVRDRILKQMVLVVSLALIYTLFLVSAEELKFQLILVGLLLLVGAIIFAKPIGTQPNEWLHRGLVLFMLVLYIVAIEHKSVMPTVMMAGFSLFLFLVLKRFDAILLSMLLLLGPLYAITTKDMSGVQEGVVSRLVFFNAIFIATLYRLITHLEEKSLVQREWFKDAAEFVGTALVVAAFILWSDWVVISHVNEMQLSVEQIESWAVSLGAIWLVVTWLITSLFAKQRELKTTQGEMQVTQQQLEKEFDKQRQLFAVISHELRTPAASLNMLLKEREGQNHEQLLGDMERVSDHLVDVMQDLRFILKPEAAQDAQKQDVRLYDLIETTLIMASPLLRENGYQSHFSSCDQCRQHHSVNAQVLRQLILNLTKNAVIHSGGNQVWIKVQAHEAQDDATNFTISIEDNGNGIPEEKVSELFEAFKRGDSEADGTGLGLYICNDLAKQLGGSLSYQRAETGGSAFVIRVSLPHAREADLAIEKDRDDSVNLVKDKTFLLAEDTETLQLVTKIVLEKQGASVIIANHGKEALALMAERNDIDVVLTDVMMPEMNGYELTEELRHQGFDKPIIAVTGAVADDEVAAMMALGANEVIEKPIRYETLNTALQKITAE